MCFSGVTSAPKGTTHFCADWRSSGHAFKENRTPSLFSRSDQLVVIITRLLRYVFFVVFIRATINFEASLKKRVPYLIKRTKNEAKN